MAYTVHYTYTIHCTYCTYSLLIKLYITESTYSPTELIYRKDRSGMSYINPLPACTVQYCHSGEFVQQIYTQVRLCF